MALVVLLLGAGTVAYPWYLRHEIRRGMSPERLKQLHAFVTKPLEVPADLPPAKPISREQAQAFERLGDTWEAAWNGGFVKQLSELHLERPNVHRHWSAEQWTSASTLSSAGRAMLMDTRALLRVADYDCGVFSLPWGLLRHGRNEPSFMSSVSDVLQLETLLALHGRDYDRAHSTSMELLAMAKRSPSGPLFGQLAAPLFEEQGEYCMATLASECSDTLVLLHALEELECLIPQLQPCSSLAARQPELPTFLGRLRELQCAGQSVEFSGTHTAAWYSMQLLKAQEQFSGHMLAQLPPGDPRHKDAYLYSVMQRGAWSSTVVPRHPLLRKATLVFVPEVLVGTWDIDMRAHSEQRRISQARLDLLRLLLAGRVLELEGKATSASLEAYVPRFMKRVPVDPFSAMPYRWNAKQGRFYSIGSDRVDGGGEEPANSWNPKAKGDVFF